MYTSFKILLLFFTAAWAAINIPDPCYDAMNNPDLTTGFYVTPAKPFASAYACNPSTTNVALAGGKYTFTASAAAEGGVASCGEIISNQAVSYGYYECELIVDGVSGTVTTCQVASTNPSNYESVYFKFIGNQTERAYIGYYTGGKSYPTGPVELGFDTRDRKHKYGFEWTSGYIRWYVDGGEVSSALGGKPIPSTPNHFYVSLLTEMKGFRDFDSLLPTEATVGREFTGLETSTSVFTNISYTPVIFVSCDPAAGILPGGNGWRPFDPSECDRSTPFTIYDDELAKGWSTKNSFPETLKLTSVSPLRTGDAAILWDVIPMTARLYLTVDKTFDSNLYYALEFWIHGNGKEGQQIGISMLFGDLGSPSTITVKIGDILDQGVRADTWSRVVVPFNLFGVNNVSEAVKGFVLSSMSTSFGGSVGIDDIKLTYELPMCADSTKSIYSDALAKGTSDQSWGVWTIGSTKVAHSGSKSIEWGMYGSSGIQLRTSSIMTRDYQGISFWINTALAQGSDWSVSVTSPDGDLGNGGRLGLPLVLSYYYGGPVPQQVDQWSYIIIPFYQFGITTNSKIDGIRFELSNQNNYQGFLYIDDINYAKQDPKKKSSAASLGAGLIGTAVMIAFLML